MRRPLALIAVLALFACTPQEEEPESAAATAAAIGEPVECINVDQLVSRVPAGPRSILFEMAGGRRYRNELPDHCPGLARAGELDVVQIEPNGAQLCRNDRVRIYDPVEARNIGAQAFPHCRLGVFTPIAAR